MNIIAFETSCDETSVAIISNGTIASNIISSQDFHTLYGGVVPELSSRAHIQRIVPLVKSALRETGMSINDIDAVAATAGPGLIGALMIGFTFAKGLALANKKPFIPVNHVEGHLFSGFLMPEKPVFPFLCLAVSGGHTLFFLAENFTKLSLLGTTIDDAAGEAFDKVAKLLELGYPGGPLIQKHAGFGDENSISFPVSELKNVYDVSFSGLKTSVLRYVQKARSAGSLTDQMRNDIAASFQFTVVKTLAGRLERAITEYRPASIGIAGGVAANARLRISVEELGSKYNLPVIIPGLKLCGDNAAMIAFRAQTLLESGEKFSLDYEAFPSFKSKYINV